jgi:preprotein translocase subunit SecD
VPEGYLPPPAPRPARRLLWLWLTLGVVAIAVVAAGTTAVILARRWDGRPSTGDVAITVRLRGPDGEPPAAAALDRTKQILMSRMKQLGLTRPTVTAIGAETLLVTAANGDAERVRALLVPGNLTFRRVRSVTSDRSDGGCRPDPQERTDRAATLASAKAKLGPTFDVAAMVQDPTALEQPALPGFDTLTCTEIAALPHTMQYAVPVISCEMLNGRPPGTLDDSAEAAACDGGGETKHLLDVAKVAGTDLAGAKIEMGQGDWLVNLRFTPAGQPKWTALTVEVVAAGQGDDGRVAVVMDNAVVVAPAITAVIRGDAVISGGWTRPEAEELAATIANGVLPLRLVITSVESVR